MERIATSIAERFNHDGHVFQTAAGEFLDVACGGLSIRVDEGFGKKRFIFQDGSAITIGDGRWYIGFQHCFCCLHEGHFPGCDNRETIPVFSSDVLPESEAEDVVPQAGEETQPLPPSKTPPVPPVEVLPNPPAFTIRTYGKINSTIAMEGSQNQARRQARGLLSSAAGVTHSCVMDASGRIVDAYALIPLANGEGKIKKIKPGDLSQLNQIELPL